MKKKLKKHVNLNTYWTKINFWKKDNQSSLILKQSDKILELCVFLNTKPKEKIYQKLYTYLQNR